VGHPVAIEASNLDRWIDKQLAVANRTRRVRLLDKQDIIIALHRIFDNPDGSVGNISWYYDMAGIVTANSYRGRAYTTICFIGRKLPENLITIDIKECNAHRGSPGRCYRELQPWRDGVVTESVAEKVENWINTYGLTVSADAAQQLLWKST
jgi:hypothetical protein